MAVVAPDMALLPAHAPVIAMIDPLADLLGAAEAGRMYYHYADAVRLAGHSCAAVAGAWLMLSAGLDWLYDEDTPRRGGIEVHLRDAQDQGTTGVIATIAALVTGAAGVGGFHGIGAAGLHDRRGLLQFDAPIDGVIGLRRRDTGAGVVLDIDTGLVPHDPALAGLLPLALAPVADAALRRRFAVLWQDRVRRMFDLAGDPRLIHIYDWNPA